MRIVVFSDSHRNFAVLERIVLAQPEAGLFLHLGDGEREFEDLTLLHPEKQMRGVQGNCDWGSQSKVMDMVNVENKRIFFTHGHTFGVKAGLTEFLHTARSLGAVVALYGHTHVAYTDYEDGLYVMNPGSVSSPNQGPPSYGVIDITPAGIVTRIVPMGAGPKSRGRRRG